MQDRNHCGEWLPDFQKVEVLGAFFLQLFISLATDQLKFRPLYLAIQLRPSKGLAIQIDSPGECFYSRQHIAFLNDERIMN